MVMGAAFALWLFLFSLCIQVPYSSSSSHVNLGIHPLDEKYYHGDFIKCKDGSKSFSRDRLNDNFCDCSDGTDEPDILIKEEKGAQNIYVHDFLEGGRCFMNLSIILLIFRKLHDFDFNGLEKVIHTLLACHFGYVGTSACPAGKFYCRNAGSTPRFLFSSRVNDDICDCCDGSDEYYGTVICPNTCVMGGNIVYQTRNYDSVVNLRKSKPGINTEDSTHKLRGLKALVWLQLGFVAVFLTFRLFWKRRARRRTR